MYSGVAFVIFFVEDAHQLCAVGFYQHLFDYLNIPRQEREMEHFEVQLRVQHRILQNTVVSVQDLWLKLRFKSELARFCVVVLDCASIQKLLEDDFLIQFLSNQFV